MKRMRLSSESIFYLLLLLLLLSASLFIEWLQYATDVDTFRWSDVQSAWLYLLPYVLVFIVHNYFMAPLLLRGGRHRWYYFFSVALVSALFFLYQYQQQPPRHRLLPPDKLRRDGFPRRGSLPDDVLRYGDMKKGKPKHRGMLPDGGHQRPLRVGPRPMGAPRALWNTVLMLLMFGMNIGVKFYFKAREDNHRMVELEKANLTHSLQQLRYQLNPHFLMNTLNNIHSLIEIDTDAAQEAVVELSRMLRYMLYDTDRERVLLRSDIDFVQHYVALMRLRYSSDVRIDVQLPDQFPDVQVPPLLFISFVENAFKHGVSYQKPSFVAMALTLDEDCSLLTFTCRNSKHSAMHGQQGGVGLVNVRQRLDLLYGDRYTLAIIDGDDEYSVQLVIPL